MSAPLVSVLIPCYNAAPWLAETLESALAQSWPHKEIIVVNDGSIDDSLAIARQFAARGVTVIDQPNAGQSAAFNRALAAARGDYLEFLDADDLIAPNKLETQVGALAAGPAGRVASCRWARIQTTIADAYFTPSDLWEPFLPPVEWLVRAWSVHQMMHGAAWLVPHALVRDVGGWQESLSLINDFEFFSRVLLRSLGVVFCADTCTYYRSGISGSLSGTKSRRAWESAHLSLRLGTARLLAHEDSPRTRAACAYEFAAFYYDAYPAVPELRRDARQRVRALGCELPPPPGGPKYRIAARLVGWRLARRLQIATARLRAQRAPAANSS